jgi:3-hydroxyisobutyrate dehydrogenase-like beta-hydroxyacid dehydrogenase
MADISVGVIGTGRMGSCHAVNVHRYVKGAPVAAIYDLDQARAGQVAAECGSARAFQDPLQLIQDAGVDAVLIASPDPTLYVAAGQRCLYSLLTEWHTCTGVNARETGPLSGTRIARRSTCQLKSESTSG